MMKKHLLYLFFFALALGSCKKSTTEPIIGDVDERLSGTLSAYQTQLSGAQFGWKGYLLTDLKVTATFLLNFTDKNRVTMSADYTASTTESSYRLKALQRPTLLFDTYSILHLIADPTPSKFGGYTGGGYYSDFEFAFLSASADTIKLEGTFNKSKLVLIRSKSAADNATAFNAPDDMAITLSKLRTYFKRASIGGLDCEVKLDPNFRVVAFSYLDGGVLKKLQSNYFVSGSSLVLFDPLTIGTSTVTVLNDVKFDTSTGFITASINGGSSIQIKEAIAPLQYDQTVAAKFLANPIYGTWSECYTGFTVDGVVDAYGITTIPNFVDLDFIPKRTATYGSIQVWTSLGYLSYYPQIISTISADGKLINTSTAFSGTATGATKTIIDNTTNNFIKPGGFYVIQTDTKVYDLVAVADARSWMTFE